MKNGTHDSHQRATIADPADRDTRVEGPELGRRALEALIRAGEDARAEAKRWGTLLWYSDGKTLQGVDPTTNEVVEERPVGPRDAS